MAFTTDTAGKVRHEEPVGAGYRGLRKVFHVKLVAATPKTLYFGGFKLKDPDNVHLVFSPAFTNGAGETVGGVPATTIAIAADGKSMTLTHSANMNCSLEICGDWVAI